MTFETRMKRKIRRTMHNAPKGGNGVYIQLSKKRGIKILRAEYETLEELKEYNRIENVLNEARAMKQAKRLFPYIPDCYGVKMLKIGDYYNVGIIIQHLGNKCIGDITEEYLPIVWKLEDDFRKLGICHNDIHSHNVMYFRHKYWVIDFACVYISKPKTN